MVKLKPVSKNFLIRLFGSNKFRTKIDLALTRAHNFRETYAFNVVKPVSAGSTIISPVFTEQGLAPESYFADIHTRKVIGREPNFELGDYGRGVFPILLYKSVPRFNYCFPTFQTFINFADVRDFTYDFNNCFPIDSKPLMVIASSQDSMTLELLLVQETGQKPMKRAFAKYLLESVEADYKFQLTDNSVVAKLIDSKQGVRADLLKYVRDETGFFQISSEELSKLERFAYVPEELELNLF
ncbi:hypothetical protein HN587_07605 [Candidatus Woesearchaeota archaeon]|jgi:hypothetical protein|nr:hypothetical protein [Candidatus Woesearchaeota archaeon]